LPGLDDLAEGPSPPEPEPPQSYWQPRAPRDHRPGWARLSLLQRLLAVLVVIAEVIGGAYSVLYWWGVGFLAWGTSSEGLAGPVGAMGLVLALTGILGAIWLALPLPSAPRLSVAVMAGIGVIATITGLYAYHADVASQPPPANYKPADLSLLRQLVPPPGATRDRTVYDPSTQSAVRSWELAPGVDACARTRAVAQAAFGPMSPLPIPGRPCTWSRSTWSRSHLELDVFAYVTRDKAQVEYADFLVGPPS
jgi:hypothetical protein